MNQPFAAAEAAEQADPAERPRLIVFGHSHINCLLECLKTDMGDRVDYRGLQLRQRESKMRREQKGVTREEMDAAAERDLTRMMAALAGRQGRVPMKHLPAVAKKEGIATVMAMRGVQHIFRGLVKADPPYDFVLPGEEDLPLDPDAQLIPSRAIFEYYRMVLTSTLDRITRIHSLIRHNMFHIESPPPYGDNAYVEAQIGGYFDRKHPDGLEVAPPLLRYKIWRVVSMIYEEHCNAIGVTYLRSPPATLVDGRYLHPDAYFHDAVHANPWYGRQVLEQLLPLLPAPARSDS